MCVCVCVCWYAMHECMSVVVFDDCQSECCQCLHAHLLCTHTYMQANIHTYIIHACIQTFKRVHGHTFTQSGAQTQVYSVCIGQGEDAFALQDHADHGLRRRQPPFKIRYHHPSPLLHTCISVCVCVVSLSLSLSLSHARARTHMWETMLHSFVR